MSDARLETQGEGRFRVEGDLDYDTVSRLLHVDDIMFSQGTKDIVVDLGGITRTTSVGLALMLEWLRMAHSKSKNIKFSNVPAQMLAMAKVSQLETILQLDIVDETAKP